MKAMVKTLFKNIVVFALNNTAVQLLHWRSIKLLAGRQLKSNLELKNLNNLIY